MKIGAGFQDASLLTLLRDQNTADKAENSSNILLPAAEVKSQQDLETMQITTVNNTQESDSAINKHSRNLIDIQA